MSYVSSTDIPYQKKVQSWIEANGEVLVLFRYHAAAGCKDFEFFQSFEAFQDRVANLPSRTCVTVFRNKQLPWRGTVNAEFISGAAATVPNGTEWLVVCLQATTAGSRSWFHNSAGESHTELQEELRSHLGASVAVGAYPPWLMDNEVVITAVVPEEDGSVVTGVY